MHDDTDFASVVVVNDSTSNTDVLECKAAAWFNFCKEW